MNTELMFSSKTDMWATPKDFYDKLNDEFHFTLDPCSTDENAKCVKHYTIEDNGLVKDWTGEIVFAIHPTGGKCRYGSKNAMTKANMQRL